MTDLPFKIAIPSRGRAKTIKKNPLYRTAYIVVRKEERDAYEAAGVPAENLVVCGPYVTISEKRQWILDNLWDKDEPFIVQIDDDFHGLVPMMRWQSVLITDPMDIAAVLWETFISANDSDCGMFGYLTDANILYRNCHAPVLLRSWVQSVVGFMDRSLSFDVRLSQSEDIEICLNSLIKKRILWVDYRWSFKRGRYGAPGGLTQTRVSGLTDDSDEIINDKYGKNTLKTGRSTSGAFRVKVKIG